MDYAQMNKAPSNVNEMPATTEDTLRNMRATMEQYMSTASERVARRAIIELGLVIPRVHDQVGETH